MIDRLFKWWARLNDKTADEVCREWHSLVIGLCETLCLCIPPRIGATVLVYHDMEREWHYYVAGRGMGVLTWVTIVTLFVRSI